MPNHKIFILYFDKFSKDILKITHVDYFPTRHQQTCGVFKQGPSRGPKNKYYFFRSNLTSKIPRRPLCIVASCTKSDKLSLNKNLF